jgi:hypothetical protein
MQPRFGWVFLWVMFGVLVASEVGCISVMCGGADYGSALTAGHFSFGKSNQNHLLLVWPSFLGFPHFGDAPWARAERTSMS